MVSIWAENGGGDLRDLKPQEAELLIAERWAVPDGLHRQGNVGADICRWVPKTRRRQR
jgi:hypothetical protein